MAVPVCVQRNLQALSADAAALTAELARVRELGAAARKLAADARAALAAQAAAREVHPSHTTYPLLGVANARPCPTPTHSIACHEG